MGIHDDLLIELVDFFVEFPSFYLHRCGLNMFDWSLRIFHPTDRQDLSLMILWKWFNWSLWFPFPHYIIWYNCLIIIPILDGLSLLFSSWASRGAKKKMWLESPSTLCVSTFSGIFLGSMMSVAQKKPVTSDHKDQSSSFWIIAQKASPAFCASFPSLIKGKDMGKS